MVATVRHRGDCKLGKSIMGLHEPGDPLCQEGAPVVETTIENAKTLDWDNSTLRHKYDVPRHPLRVQIRQTMVPEENKKEVEKSQKAPEGTADTTVQHATRVQPLR